MHYDLERKLDRDIVDVSTIVKFEDVIEMNLLFICLILLMVEFLYLRQNFRCIIT